MIECVCLFSDFVNIIFRILNLNLYYEIRKIIFTNSEKKYTYSAIYLFGKIGESHHFIYKKTSY